MGGVLGVDVGGSSIKYAAVDPGSGRLLTPLGSISTPQPGDAAQLVSAISGLARRAAHAQHEIEAVHVGAVVEVVARRPVAVRIEELHRGRRLASSV